MAFGIKQSVSRSVVRGVPAKTEGFLDHPAAEFKDVDQKLWKSERKVD